MDTYDSRITAVTVNAAVGQIIMMSVYMPTEYGTYDSYEQYADIRSKIVALYEDSAAVNIVLCGDFNCQPGSRFYRLYADFILDLNLYLNVMSIDYSMVLHTVMTVAQLIGATTTGTGGDKSPPTFEVGGPAMYWSPSTFWST